MFVLALGSNMAGRWGLPVATLERALRELAKSGLALEVRSSTYLTAPMGQLRQPDYCNMVAGFSGSIGPAALLRLAKRIERQAGRRLGPRWGPRVLDIDIVDFGGRTMGRPGGRFAAGALILPHPGAATRGFVLVPLAEALPHWRHPRLGLRARDILRRRPALRRGVRLCAAPAAGAAALESIRWGSRDSTRSGWT